MPCEKNEKPGASGGGTLNDSPCEATPCGETHGPRRCRLG
jgi:hypothetical protein